MLAPTRELVAELNARARTDRLARRDGRHAAAEVALADGTRASAGDVIITRRNDRRLTLTATDWVKNGDRWTVDRGPRRRRARRAAPRPRPPVTLPADYVAEHVANSATPPPSTPPRA